ncbi:MAG: AAA family ATPase [Thioploca sp.]|nr:AAA family ATPase [Thioploca sp.]
MYTAHFKLNAAPFSITPDPHYLYLSGRHREALAHLLYGVNEGPGFVLLTGEVGTGKTTLCRCLIEQLPDTVDVALLLNPRVSSMELLAALFDELRISYDPLTLTHKDYIDVLNSYLLTAHAVGRRTVLILDEAQNLSTEVLEQVRLLTNLETANNKLLQIILVGQPELNTLLKRNNLRQLAQRITARYHLLPLSLKDTQAYINHRLAVSGAREPLFTSSAMRVVYRYSNGVPRLINIICDRALLGGYVNNNTQVDVPIVRKAVQEVRGENINNQSTTLGWLIGIGIVTALVVLVGSVIWWRTHFSSLAAQTVPDPQSNALASTTPAEIAAVAKLPVSISPLPTPPPPPTLLELLQSATTPNNTQAAFITLFKYWNLDYMSLTGEKACQRAATQGLACLLRTGTWEDIRYFNKPTVIELVTDNGTQHHVVVSHLQDKIATLDFSGQLFEFTLDQLNEYWLGQFLLLWKPPLLPIPVIKTGIVNEAVIWVRKRLDIIEGVRSEPKIPSPRFDQALKQRVIAFQRQHQLSPDGIVGEQTLLALQALSAQAPVLWSTPVSGLVETLSSP